MVMSQRTRHACNWCEDTTRSVGCQLCLVITGLVVVLLLQILTNAPALPAPTERPVRMALTHTYAIVNWGTLGQNVKKVNHYNNSIRYIITHTARTTSRFYCLNMKENIRVIFVYIAEHFQILN